MTRRLALALSVAALQALSAVALLAASAWLISRAAEHPPVLYLMVGVVAVRAFALGRAVFRYAERLLSHDGAFRQLSAIRVSLFKALVPFAPAGFANQNRAETASKLVADVDELQNLPLRVFVPLVQVLVVTVAATIGLWLVSSAAAIVMLIGVLLAIITTWLMSQNFARSAEFTFAPKKAELAAGLVKAIDRFEMLQAYGWWQPALTEIAGVEQQLISASRRSAVTSGISQSIASLLMTLSTLATTYFAFQAVASETQPAVLLAVIGLLPLAVFDLVMSSQGAASAYNRYRASAKRVGELLDRDVPAELQFGAGSACLSAIESLELRRVSIRYPGAKVDAVSDLSFTLKAGETLLLSGPNGSGKSTAAHVLARFLMPRTGEYLINSVSAEQFDPASIRERVGYIEQAPSIFSATIRANMLLAKPEATDDELTAVLERVGLGDLLRERDGLSTELGDLGKLVSGGQAQRIALARALLADFDVVIFDEPTSSLDDENTELLVADLLSLAKGSRRRAVILISHDERLSHLADREIRL